MSVKLSRRAMLRLVAGGAAATALAACQPQVVEKVVEKEVTKIVAGTPVVEKVVEKVVETKVVEKVVEKVITPTPAPRAIPKVYIYQNSGGGDLQFNQEGSAADKLKLVTDYVKATAGVEPVGLIPPPGAAATERLNLLLASGSQEIDTFTSGDDWAQYKQVIVPLNSLFEQYGSHVRGSDMWPKDVWRGLQDAEGSIWGWPRGGGMINTEPFWVRTDLLGKLGLKMPQTLDDIDKLMPELQKQNPKAKICLSGVQSNVRRSLVGAFTEFGESNWLDPSDKKIKPPDLQPGFVDYLAKVNEWVKKGWVFEEWIDNAGRPTELLRSGNMVMYTGWYSTMTLTLPLVLDVAPEQRWGMAFGLKGPKGFAETLYARNAAHVLTRKAKNPDAVIRYVDWVYTDVENLLTVLWGVKDADWGWRWVDKSKLVITRNTKGGYVSELLPAWGAPLEVWATPDDPQRTLQNEHLRKWYYYYEGCKAPFDYGIPYDPIAIRDGVPTIADINRTKTEEIVKFALGKRPLSEFNDYLAQLDKAGLPKWIDVYTKQYNLLKGS
jgi:putative aldouronate transport system substrate-binding protein